MEEVGTSHGFCANSAIIFQLVGQFLLVFKILIPVLLIVLGVIDLGKAVVATEDKKIKESVSRLVKRIIISIVIFFLPTIISIIFGLIEEFDKYQEEYTICKRCILDPGSTNDEKTGCADYVEKYNKPGYPTDEKENNKKENQQYEIIIENKSDI